MTRGRKNPLHQSLAPRLARQRKAAALTLQEAAAFCGVDHTTILRLERSQNRARIDIVEKIATGLGIAPSWLAFGPDGERPFSPHILRYGIEPDPDPTPEPAQHECQNLYLGMPGRLALAREAGGFSMRQLGLKAGITIAAISLIESGRAISLVSTVEKLAKELGVAPGWLAYGIGVGPARGKA